MLKYFNVNDKKIACWVNPVDFGAHAQSLVFIHGSGGTSDVWTMQYSKMHTRFNILAVNLPGHGKSEGAAEQSIDGCVARLREIIGAAGLSRPLLVGHSLGAAIALSFALHHPDEPSGVAAVGGGLAMPVNPDILSGFQTNPELVMDMMCKFSLARQNRAKLYDTARARLAEADPGVVYANMLACSRFDITREAKNIRVPVLAVCGREDKMTPPAASEAIAAAIEGTKLVIIEEAGHMVMMEQPDAFNTALLDFAAEIFTPSC
ncbi:MAG TPA: alpha/beta hydrolase [Smithellaceae bacterium]|nr:alpha/beta hydrolase [Smithellaceae bacterium]